MSTPLAATSVTTRRFDAPLLNALMLIVLAVWSMLPWMPLAFRPLSWKILVMSSTWCLVETKTMVLSSGEMTSLTKKSNAPSFSPEDTVKNRSSRSSDILFSESSRTSWGSLRPALANSATMAGIVAEKSRHCLLSCRLRKIRLIWSLKPSSNMRSASSITTIFTEARLKPSISSMWWMRRPGVAMTTSGLSASWANCSCMESPPMSSAARRSVYLPKSSANLKVCMVSSRVGDKMSALGPAPEVSCAPRRFRTGSMNAAVFPEPVLLIATTSCPAFASGIAFLWIGVGSL
mmetsp:Transcript_782/g.3032  ORF Transcript_782/g.3032 Transcript_782/m.3032 type:complete len:291 (-) Transcript_782:83-955(-)